MKISQRLRVASTIDMRKILPKAKFKGWKFISWKPSRVIVDHPESQCVIDADANGPDPVVFVKHPKSWGHMAPNNLEGVYSAPGDRMVFKSNPDVEDWETAKPLLAKFFLAVIAKAGS